MRIIILAHRDSYFDGASDSASGVATTMGLAEYGEDATRETSPLFSSSARLTPWKCRLLEQSAWRTAAGLSKGLLIINAEHFAQRIFAIGPNGGPMIRRPTRAFCGAAAVSVSTIGTKAFDTFGVATYEQPDPWAQGEMGDIYQYAPSVQLIEANMLYHSDHETSETVPANGLEQSTRAYAKIIDEVNRFDIKDLMAIGQNTSR